MIELRRRGVFFLGGDSSASGSIFIEILVLFLRLAVLRLGGAKLSVMVEVYVASLGAFMGTAGICCTRCRFAAWPEREAARSPSSCAFAIESVSCDGMVRFHTLIPLLWSFLGDRGARSHARVAGCIACAPNVKRGISFGRLVPSLVRLG